MEKNTLTEEKNTLEIRRIAIMKYYVRCIVILLVCFSVISLAFATGYIGILLLFR